MNEKDTYTIVWLDLHVQLLNLYDDFSSRLFSSFLNYFNQNKQLLSMSSDVRIDKYHYVNEKEFATLSIYTSLMLEKKVEQYIKKTYADFISLLHHLDIIFKNKTILEINLIVMEGMNKINIYNKIDAELPLEQTSQTKIKI